MQPTPASLATRDPRAVDALLAAALAALVAAVFWQTMGFGFVGLDDPRYVLENPHVRDGLTLRGIRWAFSATYAANWHPLTWLSLMADVQLFGVDPGALHRTNVLWHGATTVLLFLVLRCATGARWRSACAAALFGVHPLHVESVAWISERKDVLSTFLWVLAMAAWLRYVRRPSAARYLGVAVAFTLGLLAKPMLVTLPIALLLLDVWPLGRADLAAPWRSWAPRLALEKVPLLALSLGSSAVTLLAQTAGGAVSVSGRLPLPVRAANAVGSAVAYLGKTIWPARLSAFYPHPGMNPGGIPTAHVLAAGGVLAAVTALALWQARRRPHLTVGWAWYLVTLLPVIGLVQVGRQGMADRYTYVPLVGVFMAFAWSVPSLSGRGRLLCGGAVGAWVAALALVARAQVGTWRDTRTLFSHAIALDRDDWLAWGNLGIWHFDAGRYPQALQAFREVTRAAPWDADGWANVAACHAAQGEFGAAADALERAVAIAPGDLDSWSHLAEASLLSGRSERAAAILGRLRRESPTQARELERRLADSRPAP